MATFDLLHNQLQALQTRRSVWATAVTWSAAYPYYAIWQSDSLSLATFSIATIIAFPLYMLGEWIQGSANAEVQKQRDAIVGEMLTVLREDPHSCRFCLYLRPFSITGRLATRDPNPFELRDTPEFEEVLANQVIRVGALVSLGVDMEAIGASRVEVPEEEWRARVDSFLGSCQIILMVPGYQDGTRWELEQILVRKLLPKTIFLQPGTRYAGFNATRHWARTSEDWHSTFGIVLPQLRGEAFFMIGEDKQVSDPMPLSDLKKALDTLLEVRLSGTTVRSIRRHVH